MRVYNLLTLLLSSCNVVVPYSYDITETCEVLVNIDSGPVCGKVLLAESDTLYYSFLGIPYAKSPTGERRFKELEEPDPWTEIYYAIEEGPACPQINLLYGSITVHPKGMEEDCMFVNVHVPATAELNCESGYNALPILVMVHGGGFLAGSGNTDMHGPQYMMLKDVIVITFNYRINIFGFLSLGSSTIPGNNGLRDIVTLLRWVKRNARAFGGDPDDITLIGHSAGASCVHLLTLSDECEGLFNRVIIMSGTAAANYFSTSPTFAKYIASLFLESVGINSTDSDEIHQQLIEMSLDKIMNGNSIVQTKLGLTTFVPVVETQKFPGFTRILTADPLKLLGEGKGSQYPTLFGCTDNEMEFFKWILMVLDILTRVANDYKVILTPRLAFSLSDKEAPNFSELVKQRYFNGTPTLDKFVKCYTDMYFQYSALKYAKWRIKSNGTQAYMYRYTYQSDFNIVKRALWQQYDGAAHCEDLTYIFRTNTLLGNHVSFPPQNNDDNMKYWMTTFVDNFIRCSNPTCIDDAISPWPPLSNGITRFQVIERPYVYKMSELTEYDKEMVRFLDSIDREARAIDEQLGITS